MESTGTTLRVDFNHRNYNDPTEAVYLSLDSRKYRGNSFGAIGIDEAERVIAKLSEIIKTFHDNATKEPTTKEKLDALPNHSVVRFRSDKSIFHKISGNWYSKISIITDNDRAIPLRVYDGDEWPFDVLYQPTDLVAREIRVPDFEVKVQTIGYNYYIVTAKDSDDAMSKWTNGEFVASEEEDATPIQALALFDDDGVVYDQDSEESEDG